MCVMLLRERERNRKNEREENAKKERGRKKRRQNGPQAEIKVE